MHCDVILKTCLNSLHPISVKLTSHNTSKWTAKGSAGIAKIRWKAELTKDEKDNPIIWNLLSKYNIKNELKVVFKPVGEITQIDVTIFHHALLGIAGESPGILMNPYFEKLVKSDLINFKNNFKSIY